MEAARSADRQGALLLSLRTQGVSARPSPRPGCPSGDTEELTRPAGRSAGDPVRWPASWMTVLLEFSPRAAQEAEVGGGAGRGTSKGLEAIGGRAGRAPVFWSSGPHRLSSPAGAPAATRPHGKNQEGYLMSLEVLFFFKPRR